VPAIAASNELINEASVADRKDDSVSSAEIQWRSVTSQRIEFRSKAIYDKSLARTIIEQLFQTDNSWSDDVLSSLPTFAEWNLRAGSNLSRNVRFAIGMQSVRNRETRYPFSQTLYQTSRQYVLTTEWSY
jgi:hypothetical protein